METVSSVESSQLGAGTNCDKSVPAVEVNMFRGIMPMSKNLFSMYLVLASFLCGFKVPFLYS